MRENKLTMQEIAKLAGVGKSTVSRYFNDGSVKAETRELLQKICAKYDYKPNQAAKLLKAKRTNTIGIIAPTLKSYTSSSTITVMEDWLHVQGFHTIIINTNHSLEREREAFQYLSELNVDAIVSLAMNNQYNYEEMKYLYQVPILFLGQEITNAPSVVYDDYRAGYAAGQRIAECGHRDIAFLGVAESDEAVGVIRKMGVFDALHDMGIENVQFIQADFEYEKCLPIVERFFQQHVPQAVICATDRMASACYTVLSKLQLSIPEDVSIMGFGSYRYSSLLNPPLESIRFNNSDAGRVCAQMILALVEGHEVEYRKVIGYELIKGGSVKTLG